MVRVRASCGRQPSPGDCAVDVAVNGEPADVLHLTGDFADHNVTVPPGAVSGAAGPVEVRFDGPTFVPRRPDGRDRRVLSFQLASVSLHGSP